MPGWFTKGGTRSRQERRALEQGRPSARTIEAAKAYAAARGLRYTDNLDHPGFLAALPVHVDRRFDVLQGTLPGGEEGLVFHEIELHSVPTRQSLKLVPRLVTAAAVRVPEATGLLLRFEVGHGHNVVEEDRYWGNETLDLGLDGWKLAVAPMADRAVLDPLIGGILKDVVAAAPGEPVDKHLRIAFRCGTLVVRQEGYIESPSGFDLLCGRAGRVAAGMRAACAGATQPLPFDAELPAPSWLGTHEEPLLRADGMTVFSGDHLADVVAVPGLDVPPDDTVKEWIEGIARTRGLVIEDAIAFHRAFPRATRAGQAFAVFRGPLPGTEVPGRLVAYAERRLELPHSGVNAALIPVGPDVPDARPEPVGENTAAGIRGGMLNISRFRLEPGLDGGDLDRLAGEAVEVARSRGVLAR